MSSDRPEQPASSDFVRAWSTNWRQVAAWEALFHANYFFRSVSLEIWRWSKTTDAQFEELRFGETPRSAIKKILRYLPDVGPESTIYELGCGRGRAAFWFHFLSGAKVIGVDVIGSFIKTAQWLSGAVGCGNRVTFLRQDLRTMSWTENPDVIYACALCMSSETREILLSKVLETQPGTHLVTIGWKPTHERLDLVANLETGFSWGRCGIQISKIQETVGLNSAKPG